MGSDVSSMTQIASHNSAATVRQLSGEKDVMKAIVAALGLFSAVFALAPATAAAAPQLSTVFARADLNGDGVLDQVTLSPASGDPRAQVLTGVVGWRRYSVHLPMDDEFGVQPLRVADADGDGKAEIVVTERVGANTLWFSVWGLGQRWLPVMNNATEKLYLYEGGGLGAPVGYGCEVVAGKRQLYTVSGYWVDLENDVFEGEKINYAVRFGVATAVSSQPLHGPRASFDTDPTTCD